MNSDTRGFTAERWSTANNLYQLSKADRSLAGHITTHKTFDHYIKEATSNTTNTSHLAALQSISQIYRALLNFEYRIKESVDDDRLDTSSLWAMAYLNVKVGCFPLIYGYLEQQVTFLASYRWNQAISSRKPIGG
jgi:hypothetical protein